MTGVLLDTHVLYWLVSGEEALRQDALLAVDGNQALGRLYVSAITAWEFSVALTKSRAAGRPRLDEDSPARWFRDAVAATEAKVVSIGQRIAREAAQVVTETGHRDPGDCFLMATARVRKMPLMTRDAAIRRIARDNPGYIDVIVC